MRIHLVRKETIENYIKLNEGSRASFNGWLRKIKLADWEIPPDINSTFGSADLLGKGSKRVVFDVGGNNYRMICKYAFGDKQVHLFICWIGTHIEYDKICASNKQFSIQVC